MRTLVEAARTMIQGMSKSLWAEAINTAAYVLNKTGKSSVKDKSPYELWYKRTVNLDEFKTFGNRVSVHVPKEKRLKWDAKNREGILLGYSENIKGYRILFPQTKRVECLIDVIFISQRVEENEIKINKEEPRTEIEVHEQNSQESDVEESESETEPHESQNSDMESVDSDESGGRKYNLRQTIKRPAKFNDYVTYFDDDEMSFISMYIESKEPATYDEAVSSNDSSKWKEAIQAEI